MRQIVVTQTGPGTSDAVPLDTYIAPFQVSIGVSTASGGEFSIEHTYDDVLNAAVTPTWFNTTSSTADESYLLQEDGFQILQETGSSLLTGDYTLSTYIDFPVSAVRLAVVSGGDAVQMTVLQAGRP